MSFREQLKQCALIALMFGLSFLLIKLIPYLSVIIAPPGHLEGNIPVALMVAFATVATVITLLVAGITYFGMRTSLGISKSCWVLFFSYNAVIIFVKFFFVPMSLYSMRLVFFYFEPRDLVSIGVCAFILYSLSFTILYMSARKKFWELMKDTDKVGRFIPALGRTLFYAFFILVVGYGILIGLFTQGYFMDILDGVTGEYMVLGFIAATFLARAMFQLVTEEAAVLKDIKAVSTLYSLGLILLMVYHALWISYCAMLISTWKLDIHIRSGF